MSALRNPLRRFVQALALAAAAPLVLGTTGLESNIEERLLAAHNRERAVLDVPALTWNDGLARDAAAWGRHLARIGYLRHYEEMSYDDDAQGENLWAGTRGYFSPEDMVGLWLAEKRHYKPGIFPLVSRTGRLEDVGHYTQVIWRNSTHVGCAVVEGQADDFLVCRYSEGGNVIGQRPI
jgi:hypothetical protein